MSASVIESTNPGPADLAWASLHDKGIAVTPQSFAVMYNYFAGAKPLLIARIRNMLTQQAPLTSTVIEEMYNQYIAPDLTQNSIEIALGVDEVDEAARELLSHVAAQQSSNGSYGDKLEHWGKRLRTGSPAGDLIQAVAALTIETTQASARNRNLEQQLATSITRIAKLRQNLLEVRQEATTDGLTGLSNRRSFDAKLGRAIRQRKRDAPQAFCVLMLDVDHFKQFNDRHGHRTGDQVLRLVGRLLSDNLKGRDVVARYGGEEFAVLLAGTHLSAAVTVAGQLCVRLAGQQLVKSGSQEPLGRITMSIGVAEHCVDESSSSVVERADRALYEAKRTGRNRACVASAPSK